MRKMLPSLLALVLTLPSIAACSEGQGGSTESAGSSPPAASSGTGSTGGATGSGTTAGSTGSGGTTGGTTAGTTGGTTGGSGGGGTGSIPALVNVNLQNVLNDLSIRLNIDRANIPVNAQVPIEVAANVCGVSVAALGASLGGQARCDAKIASPELAQVVQQQVAAGGSVGGGAQGGSTATTGGASGTGGASTSGAAGTSAQSSGTSETQTTPPQ